MKSRTAHVRHRTLITGIGIAAAAGLVLAGCSSTSSPPAPAATAAGAASGATGGLVLPVTANPITNTSTVAGLVIDSALVENNVDTAGKTVDDHLEIALSNSGRTPLGGFEVFYTITDPTADVSESYYAELPDSFSIPVGGTRIANFDDTGAVDHFPVNAFSLYYTSKNAMDVVVTVSAADVAPQQITIMKDAGGAENPGE